MRPRFRSSGASTRPAGTTRTRGRISFGPTSTRESPSSRTVSTTRRRNRSTRCSGSTRRTPKPPGTRSSPNTTAAAISTCWDGSTCGTSPRGRDRRSTDRRVRGRAARRFPAPAGASSRADTFPHGPGGAGRLGSRLAAGPGAGHRRRRGDRDSARRGRPARSVRRPGSHARLRGARVGRRVLPVRFVFRGRGPARPLRPHRRDGSRRALGPRGRIEPPAHPLGGGAAVGRHARDARGLRYPPFLDRARSRGADPGRPSFGADPGSRRLTDRSVRVAVAQIDTTVGDFSGNSEKIVAFGRRAEKEGSDLVLFPELAVSGYPPKDLLDRRSFLAESDRTVARITRASGSAVWLFGAPVENRAKSGRPVFNAAVAARGGRRVGEYHKRLLPTYDVFDEGRYFEPGGHRPLVLRVKGMRVGVTICEDIWNDKTFWKRPLYTVDPVAELAPLDLDLHANISASPYTLGKERLRRRMMGQIARRTRVPLVTCNLVGGNDGLVFDGVSKAFDGSGRVVGRSRSFEEDFWTIDLPGGRGPMPPEES